MNRTIFSVVVLFALSAKVVFGLEFVRVADNGRHFAFGESGKRFIAWGFNYDHDDNGRLIEDYWLDEWTAVEEDFAEMKELGANVVRVHLQTAKFMKSPTEPDEVSLGQLSKLLELAQRTGLYLDITGLACYHKQDVPQWYDEMGESDRWDVQARFWAAIAKTCAESAAVFCYDLMNEPVMAGKEGDNGWLTNKSLGGKHFVQRITRDMAGRSREDVAKLWVDKLVAAIREHDKKHMITVGVIPWATVWANAKPLFYSPRVSENLDFVSVHFYPEKGEVEKALKALAVYDIGKPIVVEETFALKCGIDEMDAFIEGSRELCSGWISFYWGTTIEQHQAILDGKTDKKPSFGNAISKRWQEYFKKKTPEILGEKR